MTDMTVTNQTTNDYWFGPLHLPAGMDACHPYRFLTDGALRRSRRSMMRVGSPKTTGCRST